MPARKSDARKSDVTAATAADTSHISTADAAAAGADESVLSTTEAAGTKSTTEGGGSKKTAAAGAAPESDKTTIEDLTLPKSIITRLAKGVLPANTQIQGNAILAMSKSTTVFINYLASHANENTLNAGKKTIMPADVFKALEDIEFDFLKEPLEAEFAKFNAIQTDKRNNYRNKVKAAKSTTDDTDMAGDTTLADTTAGEDDESGAPRSKKARVEPGGADDTEMTEEEEVAEEEDAEEEEEEEEEEAEEEDEEQEESGDETQDALEERQEQDAEEEDEALDGDESD